MLTAIRILRVLVGLVAAWQIIGLFPVITSWLTDLNSVTGDMWAIAFFKSVILAISSGAYFWLGKVKKRIEPNEVNSSEARVIVLIIAVLAVIGIAISIVIPAVTDRNNTNSTALNNEAAQVRQATPRKPAGLPKIESSSQVVQMPEGGFWNCQHGSERFRLFLPPDTAVYMSVEPDKWTLMDNLRWLSATNPFIEYADKSKLYITVDLIDDTQASIHWPAGEVNHCVRGPS